MEKIWESKIGCLVDWCHEQNTWLEFQNVQNIALLRNNLFNIYFKQLFYLGENGQEVSPPTYADAVEKDNERSLQESVLQSEDHTAHEEIRSIKSPPVLSSQISIPLD